MLTSISLWQWLRLSWLISCGYRQGPFVGIVCYSVLIELLRALPLDVKALPHTLSSSQPGG